MMPIPQLLDGLSRGRLDIVQCAIVSHRKAFRSDFIKHLMNNADPHAEDHISRMSVFFETIMNHIQRCDKKLLFIQNIQSIFEEHLKTLLQDLDGLKFSLNSSSFQQKKAVSELLNYYLKHIETSQHDVALRPEAKASTSKLVIKGNFHSNPTSSVLFVNLSSKSDEDVVRQSLLSADALAVAKQVLLSRGGRSMEQVLQFVDEVAEDFIQHLLQSKKIETAKDVLHNIDRDVWSFFKELFLKTCKPNIRDYIGLELNSLGLLEPLQLDAWKFLTFVEDIIKNTNLEVYEFEGNLKLRQVPVEDRQKMSVASLLNLPFSDAEKKSLLMELYFETQNGLIEAMLTKEECWDYLLSNEKLKILIMWIQLSFSNYPIPGDSGRLVTFLSNWNISQAMIDKVPKSCHSAVIADCLLDYLSKFGHYTSEEYMNVPSLFSRTIRTGQIIDGLSDNMEAYFVNFCIKSFKPDLFVSCALKTDQRSPAWLDLFQKVKELRSEADFKSGLLNCIGYCSQYLESSNFSASQESSNPWICLSSLILSDQTISDLFNGTSENDGWNSEYKKTIQEELMNYPHLLSIAIKNGEGMRLTDLSLQVLLNQRFFDCSQQILKEDSLCSMFRENPEGINVDFSHEPTIVKYGCHEMLDFKFFLKHGRPCHAAMHVLAEVIQSFGKPSRKLLKRTVLATHELALMNWTDDVLISSCVAFLEILGEPSLALRTHLAVMKQIYSFKVEEASICNGPEKCDDSHFKKFLMKSRSPQDVLNLLLTCLPLNMHLQGLAVHFSTLHKLSLPKTFLIFCAQRNDWFSFLLFCQINNYPSELVKNVANQFKSVALRDHMESFLNRYSEVSALKATTTESRTRKISRPSDGNGLKKRELVVTLSDSGTSEGNGSPGFSLVLPCIKDTIFGVLFACHGCIDPAESLLNACIEIPCPTLAVLAEFYQANVEAQLMAWITSYLPQEERVTLECQEKNAPWPPNLAKLIILKSFEVSLPNLCTGFEIFVPKHPILILLKMLLNFIPKDSSLCVKALLHFKEECQGIGKNLYGDLCKDGAAWNLSCLSFVCDVGEKILINYLQNLSSPCDKKKLLQIFIEADIQFSHEGSVLNPRELLSALNILSCSKVNLDVKSYLNNSSEEIRLCSERLREDGYFKEATDLSGDSYVVEEYKDKFKKWQRTRFQDFSKFCSDCNYCFVEYSVDAFEAFKFFQECASNLKQNSYRWIALHNALKWLKNCTVMQSSELMNDTEREMWKCCFVNEDSTIFDVLEEQLRHTPLNAMCSEEITKRNITFTDVYHVCDELCEEQHCPQKLVDCLLDLGDIQSASRVLEFFQINHKDFEILLTCLHFVEGKLHLQEVPADSALFSLLKFENLSTTHQCLQSSASEYKASPGDTEDLKTEIYGKLRILLVVQELCKKLGHGKDIGKQLVACHRLSINLGLTYKNIVVITDPLKLLKTAVSQSSCGDFSIASDVMTAFRLSPVERVKFLSREIIAAISKGLDPGTAKPFHLWGVDLEQHFQKALGLVPDPILFGDELMYVIGNLSIMDGSTPKTVLMTAVELLVRAHDCYATGCHIEGISKVLRSVSNFTSALKTRSEWAMMVRLLTGIQRYTEMKYIFKILKENDQFEFLLRKEVAKTLSFKLALLDWLRKECPDDTTLLKMTAANFQMHQQEGASWQKEGSDRLKAVLKNGLCNNQGTKSSLQTALQDFTHASECYLQAEMLNHAMMCAHQAELVALQLYFVSSGADKSVVRVILLDSKSISKLIVSTLSFQQALIVARAYNFKTDWSAPLFYHCISPGLSRDEYFSAWSSCNDLTSSIVQNMAYRLQRTKGITREMTRNMQWILHHVKDIDVRYKIASELGLKEMVQSLLQAPEVAYLKDTVWQSGFKR